MDVNQKEQLVEERDELMIKSNSTTGPYIRNGYFLKPQRYLHGEITEAVPFLPTLKLSNANRASEPACKNYHVDDYEGSRIISRTHELGDMVHGMQSQMDPTLVSYCNKIAEQGGAVIELVFMYCGEKLEEKEIEMAHLYRTWLHYSRKFKVVSWLLVLLFEARREHKGGGRGSGTEGRYMCSYVDFLLDVRLEVERGRGLTDEEMVALRAGYMNAGTDNTWTTLQWVMAELVIHRDVQDRLYKEIESVVQLEESMHLPYIHIQSNQLTSFKRIRRLETM